MTKHRAIELLFSIVAIAALSWIIHPAPTLTAACAAPTESLPAHKSSGKHFIESADLLKVLGHGKPQFQSEQAARVSPRRITNEKQFTLADFQLITKEIEQHRYRVEWVPNGRSVVARLRFSPGQPCALTRFGFRDGDIITDINGQPVHNKQGLSWTCGGRPGPTIIGIKRNRIPYQIITSISSQ